MISYAPRMLPGGAVGRGTVHLRASSSLRGGSGGRIGTSYISIRDLHPPSGTNVKCVLETCGLGHELPLPYARGLHTTCRRTHSGTVLITRMKKDKISTVLEKSIDFSTSARG